MMPGSGRLFPLPAYGDEAILLLDYAGRSKADVGGAGAEYLKSGPVDSLIGVCDAEQERSR